jgi:GDP-4-dehydro-6-deoxy-D-mannose reductase
MAPRRILVTGASGFVGRHLTVALHAAFPHAIVLTDRFDICDATSVASAVQSAAPDACVHLAAISSVAAAREDEERAWSVNLHGTLSLARAILQHAPGCSLVFASTADAYGGTSGSINEATPLAPRSVYAATKAAADLALGAMAGEGLRMICIRPFNHTGSGQSPGFVVPAFARQIARIAAGTQPPVMEVGNLDTWRDFLDVRDVCAAYIAAIERRAALSPGVILNVGSGMARRVGDVLAELMTLAGVTAEVRSVAARVRLGETGRAWADTTRARALLGWVPSVPWSATLHAVLEDWQQRTTLGRDEI